MISNDTTDRDSLPGLFKQWGYFCKKKRPGRLQRTPRGRVATRRAYEHLGYPVPPGTAGTLFS